MRFFLKVSAKYEARKGKDGILYIIGQALGVVAIILGFLSFQMHTQKQLLLMQLLTGLVFCIHYLLIGAISGMALNVVVLIRNGYYYYRSKKENGEMVSPIVFTLLMLGIGILTWEAWYSVFAVLGLTVSSFCMAFRKAPSVRKSVLVTCPLVLLYDAFAHSYGGIVYESVAFTSALIGILRNRSKDKKEQERA